ncbi:cytochrome P450 6k1-like [Ischnura elegans]|uniref:cytochrome P450 6k1-like n=1 Tax=Ischnura elegans TaxID=197161 RepID=UPI001ED8B3B4|nr:cytochrome P450 6k1-like [Ischnura elegans]
MEGISCAEILGLATGVLCVAFVWFFVVPLWHWRRKGIPHAPAVPFFGSMKDSFLQKVAMADEQRRIYSAAEGYRYTGYHKFSTPALMLRDPELIKEVMVKEFSSFHDNDFDVTLSMDPMMGRNLFFMSGERWKRMRTTLTPAFSAGKMKLIFPLILDIVEDLNKFLEESKEAEFEMKDIFARMATNVVASCAFGIKIDVLRSPEDEFRKIGREILEPTPTRGFAQLLFLSSPLLTRILRVRFVPDKCTDFFRGVVRNVISVRSKSRENRKDFLNMMISLKNAGKLGVEPGKGVPLDEDRDDADMTELKEQVAERILNDPQALDDVTAQLLGFFLDGHETSSSSIAFTLFELAHNPDVQQKLREEVAGVKAEHGGELTYEALQEMPYLEMVQLESLRKFPPVPFTPRRCTRRYYFPPADERAERESGGLWVEAGTPVMIPIYSIHRDPKHYPDPDAFIPERFAKGKEGKSVKGDTFLAFGEGPRMCIGNRFARLVSKAAIAALVSSYQFKPCNEKTPNPIEWDPASVLLYSKRGLWVKCEKI